MQALWLSGAYDFSLVLLTVYDLPPILLYMWDMQNRSNDLTWGMQNYSHKYYRDVYAYAKFCVGYAKLLQYYIEGLLRRVRKITPI